MHHLTADIGWPYLVLAAVILVLASPALVWWVRAEWRLVCRAWAFNVDERPAREERVIW